MEFTLARNHAGKLPSSLTTPRTEGAGLANQGWSDPLSFSFTCPRLQCQSADRSLTQDLTICLSLILYYLSILRCGYRQ